MQYASMGRFLKEVFFHHHQLHHLCVRAQGSAQLLKALWTLCTVQVSQPSGPSKVVHFPVRAHTDHAIDGDGKYLFQKSI